jgi:hypothetical protein
MKNSHADRQQCEWMARQESGPQCACCCILAAAAAAAAGVFRRAAIINKAFLAALEQ